MAGLLYEVHSHTSQASKCGRLSGGDVARLCKKNGLTGVIITDHFFNGNCAISPELPWKERVDAFFAGYREAKEVGDEIGLDVFCGWEYNYLTTEFLTYGLTAEWLYENDDVLTITPEEYCDRVHRDGGFIVHAHPFRERPYIKYIRLFPNYVDAVEIHNMAHYPYPQFDKRAEFYADSYGKRKLVGSDLHFEWPTGYCCVEFGERLTDVSDFINHVKDGKYRNVRTDTTGRVIMIY